MKKIFFTTSALMLTLTTGTAFAAEKPSDLAKQIQMLQQQIQSMQQQLDAVKANEKTQTDAIAQETAAREAAEKAAREANLEAGGRNVVEGGTVRMLPPAKPKVTQSGSNRFAMSSADGAWTIAPTGRVHFDFGGFINQNAELATGPASPAGKLTGGVNARRARLGVTGKAMGDFTYSFILDAGGGAQDSTAGINEARLGYTGIKNTVIEIGYGSQYFTMEEATSSNDIVFLERSTPTTIASGINAGDPRAAAGFRTWEPNKWWFGAYLTAGVPNTTHGGINRGFGAYERATYQVLQNDRSSLHIGVGAAQVFKPADDGTGSFGTHTLSDRPENRIDGQSIFSSGALGNAANPVTGIQVYSAELAGTYGGFFAQGEYFHIDVDRRGKTSAGFDGGYLLASYTIGGRRSYNSASGAYSGVNPVTPFSPSKGGLGAFELAARISYQNLTDQYSSGLTNALQPNAVNGGQQTNFTAGVNWYWNSNMLWKLNYIHTNIDKTNNVTTGGVFPTRAGIELDAIVARMQFMF